MEKKKVFKIITFIIYFIYIVSMLYFIYINSIRKAIFILACILGNFILIRLNKKYSQLFPDSIVIILIIFIMFSILFGTCFNMYDRFIRYDDFLHLWSGIISCSIAYLVFVNLGKYEVDNNMRKIFFVIYMIMFAIGVSGIWELIEFSLDKFFCANCQAGGLVDTMVDMFDGLIGTILITPYYFCKLIKSNKMYK